LRGEPLEGHRALWLLLLYFTIFIRLVTVFDFNVELDALENAERHEFQDKAPNQLTCANGEADGVLLHVQGVCLDKLATNLNQDHLNNDGCKEDDNEPNIVEEVGENVQFIGDFPRIDQVENLHEDENLEDDGVVKHLFGVVPVFVLIWRENGIRFQSCEIAIAISLGIFPCLVQLGFPDAVKLLQEFLIVLSWFKSSASPYIDLILVEQGIGVEWVPRITGADRFR